MTSALNITTEFAAAHNGWGVIVRAGHANGLATPKTAGNARQIRPSLHERCVR